MDGMHTNSTAGVSGFSGLFRPPESFSMVPANPASLKGIACGLRSAIKHKYFEAIELRRPYNFSRVLLFFSGVVFAIQLDNLKMIQSSSVEGADDHKGQPSSSRTNNWSALKNPRIVRVTRAFGGKDRHSKVRTIRGLRDRRVRLSMPTAIQLYDLQDKLGFNQPSKVVDWLINAAQHEIDKLPPLEMLQGDPTIFSWVPQTANPDISTISCTHDHEHTNNNLIRIKEREATLNLGSHGVGSENSEATYNPYFQLENSSNGCLPITILASYLAAASNSTEAKQYAWPHSDQLFK